MEKDKLYYRNLFQKHLRNECSPEETGELFDYIEKESSNRHILDELQSSMEIQEPNHNPDTGWPERIRKKLEKKISGTQISRITGSRLARAAVVAGVIFFSAALVYFFGERMFKGEVLSRKSDNQPVSRRTEEGVTLLLGNGEMIDLSKTKNGALNVGEKEHVIKADGEIIFNGTRDGKDPGRYNTLTVPNGQQYIVSLEDGSKVWLNASSSLRFPVKFGSEERRVELTGEGYFEIRSEHMPGGKKKPFFVQVNTAHGNGGVVEVLGTRFNIMAYNEESRVSTTLLEGSVNWKLDHDGVMLSPGQQAQLTKSDNQVDLLNNIDTSMSIAWKNGFFQLDNADFHSIMRELERWYDVHVSYAENIPDISLSGTISRNYDLSQVLEIFEATHKVQFKREGRELIVENYRK